MNYYVVDYNSSANDVHSITVEEWQIRMSAEKSPCGRELLKAGDLVEVAWDISGQVFWFLAKVTKQSPLNSDTVQVSYKNELYSKERPDEAKTRGTVPKINVSRSTDPTSLRLWKEPIIRLISDEEHIVQSKYKDFCTMKSTLSDSEISDPVSFEPHREQLCDWLDSFTNARHYAKSQEILLYLIAADDRQSTVRPRTNQPTHHNMNRNTTTSTSHLNQAPIGHMISTPDLIKLPHPNPVATQSPYGGYSDSPPSKRAKLDPMGSNDLSIRGNRPFNHNQPFSNNIPVHGSSSHSQFPNRSSWKYETSGPSEVNKLEPLIDVNYSQGLDFSENSNYATSMSRHSDTLPTSMTSRDHLFKSESPNTSMAQYLTIVVPHHI
eukprot:TRINITY_DN3780_c0_g1_i3.p1 TRINITY_DN3780_c0_g1~~TRINITY_DN3780_c0_g1_i3.p1  ORF type:complete len:424 (-),score=26.33 TRINITY_DN3780_c0_g1_i3:257-1393(-)